jgi:hypothetical protein
MSVRTVLAGVGLAACGCALAWQMRGLLADPAVMPPDDFVEYWAAGRLNLHGQNPYSPDLLLPLEQAAGGNTPEAVMMWNPPWTLSAAMPLGAMPARPAQIAWLLLNFAFILFCADRVWRLAGGPKSQRWVAYVLALTFLPTFFVLRAGQITPLVLLGVVLYSWFQRLGRPGLAGAIAVLVAIKPHLVILLWVAVAVEAVFQQRWATVIGGTLAGVAALTWPLAVNSAVFDQYLDAYRTHPPVQWMSLTLGTLLRLVFGWEKFWLNAVPLGFGLAWFAWRNRRHRDSWDWADRMPALVLVSFVTAPYGAWHFDLVLLLLPIVHLAAKLSATRDRKRIGIAILVYGIAALGMLAINLAGITSIWFAWVAPLVLLAYYGLFPAPLTRRVGPRPISAVTDRVMGHGPTRQIPEQRETVAV